uniref:Uncharacterized protein n=1 Tax=Tanacetum cinerariifolium TaxID=118510 RepID=A0A699RNI6_TANCI|nr:hypothetical protein [Tanacetum cinerariifolium]
MPECIVPFGVDMFVLIDAQSAYNTAKSTRLPNYPLSGIGYCSGQIMPVNLSHKLLFSNQIFRLAKVILNSAGGIPGPPFISASGCCSLNLSASF